MIDRFYSSKNSSRQIALIGSLLVCFCAPNVSAEKYFTWVDEMGRVNHTVIPEEENPLIKPDDSDGEETDKTVDGAPSIVAPIPTPTSTSTSTSTQPSSIGADAVPEKHDLVVEHPNNVNNLEKTLSGPELELKTAPAMVDTHPQNRSEGPRVEINEDDYIDGDVLLQQGNIRSQDDLPYYTWTDERGIVRNTPYRPTDAKTVSGKDNVKNIKEKKQVVYTAHQEYRRADSSGLSSEETATNDIDSFAQKLFFDGKSQSFIDSFASKCCVDLPKESPSALDFEDSVYVELDEDAEAYMFSEGKSPFKLVALPEVQEVYSLSVKSFVKTSGKRGIKNGVFFPQLVFLDDQFQVLRIIRNPVLEYTPENWRRHGYLKGLFEINGSDNERYMLINTTKENLRASNRIENKDVVVLNNQIIGSFELEALKQ